MKDIAWFSSQIKTFQTLNTHFKISVGLIKISTHPKDFNFDGLVPTVCSMKQLYPSIT